MVPELRLMVLLRVPVLRLHQKIYHLRIPVRTSGLLILAVLLIVEAEKKEIIIYENSLHLHCPKKR
jgi:hypothetical protein